MMPAWGGASSNFNWGGRPEYNKALYGYAQSQGYNPNFSGFQNGNYTNWVSGQSQAVQDDLAQWGERYDPQLGGMGDFSRWSQPQPAVSNNGAYGTQARPLPAMGMSSADLWSGLSSLSGLLGGFNAAPRGGLLGGVAPTNQGGSPYQPAGTSHQVLWTY